jgi:hypothetical protein
MNIMMMKIRTGLLVGIGLIFGISAADAHPDFIPGVCHFLLRDRARLRLNLDNAEQLDFRAPLLRVGDPIVTCTGDQGPGALVVLNFANTGDTCDLGPEAAPVAKTKDWSETIKANGETTLICRFGPR